MTPEEVHEEVLNLRAELHKVFGDFKADLIKTIWITQLSTIAIILIGIGLLASILILVRVSSVAK